MQEAAQAYGVPIVGGHTTHTGSGKAALGAAVLGHAGDRLISPEDVESALSHFNGTRITCRGIGHFKAKPGITLTADGDTVELDLSPPGTHAVDEEFTVGSQAV